MSTAGFSESVFEDAALEWLEGNGYTVLHGPEIAVGESAAERTDAGYHDVILEGRFRDSLKRLNPKLSVDALDDAYRKLTRVGSPTLIERNRDIHRMFVDGISTSDRRKDGTVGGAIARVFDFDDPDNNDWVAVNQFTVVEGRYNRRPDVILFVNGLPLAVIELKNPADENATVWAAHRQLLTYQDQIPSLFNTNVALVVSDGTNARIGVLGAGKEWFKPWRTIGGREDAPDSMDKLQVLFEGVFDKRRFLDLIRYFVTFEDSGDGKIVKKMAGYHQFHAVNVAVEETLRAARLGRLSMAAEVPGRYEAGRQHGGDIGDRRIGVVWHTQGSGKSLTMAFFAGRLVLHPAMENPTIVVLTDRNDLDDQLFATFAANRGLLRQPPVQAESREDLRKKLSVGSGGVVFTTLQKFFPEEKGDKHPVLSDRSNIIVIADEAHRSQYEFVDGYARHMRDALPHASFIGFTGTPIEKADANTRSVFGDYISIYDIQRAVEDKATVPIYYEGRLAKLELKESEKPTLDLDFEEATEGEEVERREKLKTRWAQLEAVVGAEKRIRTVARDIVAHFEKRAEAMAHQVGDEGKAMIVCMSRRICAALYDEIAKLRPDWADPDDAKGVMKVVMTGAASDPPEWQVHIRNKPSREEMAKRFRNPKDPFKIVIVRDMWLTGFDAPSLHTMYVDKPMRGHGLMQAIARVNRVFRDKPGGLVVDYLGLADELRQALVTYTESGGTGKTAIDQKEAVALMQEKLEISRGLFHGLDWSLWLTGTAAQRVGVLPKAQEFILQKPDGKSRLLKVVTELSQAFTLAMPNDAAVKARDEVWFFKAVRAALVKGEVEGQKSEEDLNLQMQQIISRAVASDEVVDIFTAAGLKKPDISILSDEFLAEIKRMPQRNLAVELLRKLLKNELGKRSLRNAVQSRKFSEMLEAAIRKYQARAIETAQVIEEMIAMAKEMREADQRGEKLGLSEEEVAFYDALETNDSAVKVMGDENLRFIARGLVKAVRGNVKIDWTIRENVRAEMRVIIKRILRRYGYPPDKQEKATQTVLEQAELLCACETQSI